MSVTFTDQRYLSAQELTRLSAAVEGTYVFPSTAGGAVTANSGLTLNVSAISGAKVKINGTLVATAYAGGTVTVGAANATNPRRDYIYYNSSGTVAVKAGTASATPLLPDLASTEIAVAEIYIAANDTTISGASEIIDRRQDVSTGMKLVASVNTPTSTTSTSAVDLVTISGLSIPATSGVRIVWQARKQALGATSVAFGIKLNSTVVIEAEDWFISSEVQQAEDGICEFEIAPRATNYLAGMTAEWRFRVSATGAEANQQVIYNGTPAAILPNATITSLAIRARNNSSTNNAAEVSSIQVWQLG